MELSGDRIINAPQERVYDALHDPVTLRQVLPGCQSLTVSDGKSQLTSLVKVGPIRASVSTTVEVFNEDRPAGYSLYAIANAGPAGSAAGTAHVALAPVDETTTNLAYHLSVDLDGRLADLGQDVIEETARTLIAEFFSRLKLLLETSAEGVVAAAMAAAASARAGTAETAMPAQEARREETTRPLAPPPPPPSPSARSATPASTRMVFGDAPAEVGALEADRLATAGDPLHEPMPPRGRPDDDPEVGIYGGRAGGAFSNRSEWGSGEVEVSPERSTGMSSLKRWLLVALGLAAIVYLLGGGI